MEVVEASMEVVEFSMDICVVEVVEAYAKGRFHAGTSVAISTTSMKASTGSTKQVPSELSSSRLPWKPPWN